MTINYCKIKLQRSQIFLSTRVNKMKVIWTKGKLQDFYYSGIETNEEMGKKISSSLNGSLKGRSWVTSKGGRLEEAMSNNTVTLHARASGDGACAAGRCCRVCGAERALRRLGDCVVWEGVEERYDLLLADCFGVRVSPTDGFICERCISQLRSTQKFRALVYTAFEKSCSECTSLQTTIAADESTGTVKNCAQTKETSQHNANDTHPIDDIIKNNKDQEVVNKKILELLTKKVLIGTPRKQSVKKRSFSNNNIVATKRMIVVCSVCGQRYPMMVPTDNNSKLFICSRCKLKKHKEKPGFCRKCNVVMQASAVKDHMTLHAKAEGREKSRLSNLQKKPSLKNVNNATKAIPPRKNYQCNKCPKKCLNARTLQEHAKGAHGINLECVCSVCGKDLKTRYLLDQHLRLHAGETLYECDICKRVFKGKNALQLHYLTHDNFLPANNS